MKINQQVKLGQNPQNTEQCSDTDTEESCTNPEDCRYNASCYAQLCPFDVTIEDHFWYPNDGENVCKKRDIAWVRIQKSMDRMKLNPKRTGYFTVKMLKELRKASRNLRGLSPDVDASTHEQREEAWIIRHRKKVERARMTFIKSIKP